MQVDPKLSDFVRRHPRLFVLTGAGCSTDSGIPDYRDRNGDWKRKAPVTYQTQLFNLKELDIMGSRNATIADFHSVIAHLEAAEGAHALITRIVPFDEAEGALPYWDANRDSVLKLVIER